MIRADTSIWIAHFRHGRPQFKRLLDDGQVLVHPFVSVELACGSLADRKRVLALLDDLPRAIVAENEQVRWLIESRRLYGRGLGWVDLHLRASAALMSVSIRTSDRALATAAGAMGLLSGPASV